MRGDKYSAMLAVIVVESIRKGILAEPGDFIAVDRARRPAILRLPVGDKLECKISVVHQATHCAQRTNQALAVSVCVELDSAAGGHLFGHLPAHHVAHSRCAKTLNGIGDIVAGKECNSWVCSTSHSRPIFNCLPYIVGNSCRIAHSCAQADRAVAPRLPRNVRIKPDKERVVQKRGAHHLEALRNPEAQVRSTPTEPGISIVKRDVKRLRRHCQWWSRCDIILLAPLAWPLIASYPIRKSGGMLRIVNRLQATINECRSAQIRLAERQRAHWRYATEKPRPTLAARHRRYPSVFMLDAHFFQPNFISGRAAE